MFTLLQIPSGTEWLIILVAIVWVVVLPILFFVYRAKYKDMKRIYEQLLNKKDGID